jgi:hypothetical protein
VVPFLGHATEFEGRNVHCKLEKLLKGGLLMGQVIKECILKRQFRLLDSLAAKGIGNLSPRAKQPISCSEDLGSTTNSQPGNKSMGDMAAMPTKKLHQASKYEPTPIQLGDERGPPMPMTHGTRVLQWTTADVSQFVSQRQDYIESQGAWRAQWGSV